MYGSAEVCLVIVALLGKWCWRLLIDRDSLWYTVLSARYRVEGGRVSDGG